MICNLLSL